MEPLPEMSAPEEENAPEESAACKALKIAGGNVLDCVVALKTFFPAAGDEETVRAGSGVFVLPWLIVTSAHVVALISDSDGVATVSIGITVGLDSQGETFRTKLMALSFSGDVAVLKAEADRDFVKYCKIERSYLREESAFLITMDESCYGEENYSEMEAGLEDDSERKEWPYHLDDPFGWEKFGCPPLAADVVPGSPWFNIFGHVIGIISWPVGSEEGSSKGGFVVPSRRLKYMASYANKKTDEDPIMVDKDHKILKYSEASSSVGYHIDDYCLCSWTAVSWKIAPDYHRTDGGSYRSVHSYKLPRKIEKSPVVEQMNRFKNILVSATVAVKTIFPAGENEMCKTRIGCGFLLGAPPVVVTSAQVVGMIFTDPANGSDHCVIGKSLILTDDKITMETELLALSFGGDVAILRLKKLNEKRKPLRLLNTLTLGIYPENRNEGAKLLINRHENSVARGCVNEISAWVEGDIERTMWPYQVNCENNSWEKFQSCDGLPGGVVAGSPWINSEALLIGMVSWRIEPSSEGIFVVPSGRIKEVFDYANDKEPNDRVIMDTWIKDDYKKVESSCLIGEKEGFKFKNKCAAAWLITTMKR